MTCRRLTLVSWVPSISMFWKKRVHPSGDYNWKHNVVSSFWNEKVWLFVDYLQIYGVLWNMGQSWGWPYIWIQWTKWSVWANLDYFSTTSRGATGGSSQSFTHQFGEMDNYVEYTFLFMMFPVVVGVGYLISCRVTSQYGIRNDKYEARIECMVSRMLQLLYMPICLAVSRLYYCENGVLSVDPSNDCMSGQHLIMSCLGIACVFPLLAGLPVYLYKRIHAVVVFDMATDHEKRLQAWELEKVFMLDTVWDKSQVWLTSSYTRPGAYGRLYVVLFKAYTVCVFLLCRFSLTLQATLFWMGTVWMFYQSVWRLPFRAISSNLIAVVLTSLLVINSTFAMCNAFGVQNSVMVSSTESEWLLVFNATGLALILLVLVLSAMGRLGNWPSTMTLRRMNRSDKWSSILEWVRTIEEANAINLDVYLSPAETADILALEEVIRRLRRCWMAASAVGSVFTVILSDHLNKSMVTHAMVSPTALRHKKYWDKEYIKSGKDMFDTRHKKYKLWNEKKRRIQLKLFAVSAIMGGKVVKKAKDYERDVNGMSLDINQRLGEMMGKPKEQQSAETVEKWLSNQEYEALSHVITLLTVRTEAALREVDEEEADGDDGYTQALQSDEDRQKEQEKYRRQVSELLTMYEQWDTIIGQYEKKELPGGSGVEAGRTEDWYTYRHVTANTLQMIRGKMNDKKISVDSDSDEDIGHYRNGDNEKNDLIARGSENNVFETADHNDDGDGDDSGDGASMSDPLLTPEFKNESFWRSKGGDLSGNEDEKV